MLGVVSRNVKIMETIRTQRQFGHLSSKPIALHPPATAALRAESADMLRWCPKPFFMKGERFS